MLFKKKIDLDSLIEEIKVDYFLFCEMIDQGKEPYSSVIICSTAMMEKNAKKLGGNIYEAIVKLQLYTFEYADCFKQAKECGRKLTTVEMEKFQEQKKDYWRSYSFL